MKRAYGFTIVELLIVIVVLAILATLSYVGYSNFQARARDSVRKQNIQTIAKALEIYYVQNGSYPASGCLSSCPSPKKINASWATTSDGSWSVLEAALVPNYLAELPKDPLASTTKNSAIDGGYNFDYYVGAGFCGATNGQMFLLTYNLESSAQENKTLGTCSGTTPTYPSSKYITVK